MLFPLLYLAASLSLGIYLASVFHPPLILPVIALLASLAAAWLAHGRRKDRLSLALALGAVLFIGWSLYAWEDSRYERNPVRTFAPDGYADFTGRLYRAASFGVDRTHLYLRVEKISVRGQSTAARGNLRVAVLHPSVYPSPLAYRTGDRVFVSAKVIPHHDFRNFSESRLAGLRKNLRLHNQALTKSSLLVRREPQSGGISIPAAISASRLALQRNIEEHFSAPDGRSLSQQGAVLEAMLLGERGRMDEETTAALQRSGLFHLIAISGAHIGIISVLFFSVLRFFRMPKRASYLVLIVFLLFYSLLVEGRASVFRATIMALAYLLGRLLWRESRLLNTISGSAFALLLTNPFYLFDIGFELTFAATLSIILFYRKLLGALPRLPLRMSELFAVSLTAQLGVLPIIAAAFNRVTFAALVLNFPAIPLVGVVMAAGFAFLAVSPLSGGLAALMAPVLRFLVDVFLWIARSLDPVPAASFRIPGPRVPVVVGYYLFLLLLLARPRFKGQKPLVALAFAAFGLTLVTSPFPARFSPSLRTTLLDVGQGDAILVEFPGRKKMLVDGGGVPDAGFDIGENVVSPFLWRLGVKKLDYLVLTHAHPDHFNGLMSVARNFRAAEFWEAFSPEETPAYSTLKGILGKACVRRRVFRGFERREGAVRIEALHPEPAAPLERKVSNDDSLVLRLTQDGQSILLASDVGSEAERDIVLSCPGIRSRVLKSPHHGSRTSSSAEFLGAVRPEIVIISAGRSPSSGVLHPDVIERYRAAGARILRTDHDGAIEITFDGRGLFIRTAASPGMPD